MWPRAKLKFVARLGYGDALPNDESQDGAFRVFGSNGPFASFSRANTGAPAIVIGRKGSYGKVNWTAEPCFASDTTFFVDESTSRNHLRWIYWLLQTLRLDEGTDEAAVPGLNRETVYSRDVLVPPLPQQRVIADYLDREAARLDALMAAKERVLGLLAEKRRALITRSVTRGLDTNVPLHDPGIPWLGEIPAHWSRMQLRRFAHFVTSGSRGWAEHYSDSGSLFVRIGNLTRDSIHLDLRDAQYVDPPEGSEGERTKIQPGDLLFSITAYLGSIAVAPVGLGKAYINQHIALVRLGNEEGLDPMFAAYTALSDIGKSQLAGQGYGGTKTQLALDDIRELWFPVPPLHEQMAIIRRIERETSAIDGLRSSMRRTIALLRERRAALISAAITGQLEVT